MSKTMQPMGNPPFYFSKDICIIPLALLLLNEKKYGSSCGGKDAGSLLDTFLFITAERTKYDSTRLKNLRGTMKRLIEHPTH